MRVRFPMTPASMTGAATDPSDQLRVLDHAEYTPKYAHRAASCLSRA
jgi:hypothetical protein